MERSAAHMRARAEAVRAGDSRHLLSAHGACPSVQSGGWPGGEHAMERGNDWQHAEHLDGYGCSHFPFWGDGFDETGFGLRVESTRSAAAGKVVWVSELQGGSARDGVVAHRSVTAGPQQRWVANGMARGAKAVIFWCWRDEVFGNESSGFGLDGWDGLAPERLAAMKRTSDFIDRHNDLIDNYKPDAPRVGVLFAPDNYYLRYTASGSAAEAGEAVVGYATALERLCLPYEVVEANHLDVLERLDLFEKTVKDVRKVQDTSIGAIYDLIHKVNREVARLATELLEPREKRRAAASKPARRKATSAHAR
jgi:beta-galactosidase